MGSCWAHCRGGSCNHDYWLGNRPLVFEVLSEADAASRRQSGPSWRRHGSVYSERFVHPRNESGRDFSRAEPVEQDNVLLLEEARFCPLGVNVLALHDCFWVIESEVLAIHHRREKIRVRIDFFFQLTDNGTHILLVPE